MKKQMMKEVTVICCDICHEEIKHFPWGEEFDLVSTEVSMWSDNKTTDKVAQHLEHDVCGKCFKEKLSPWLESQKTKPTV